MTRTVRILSALSKALYWLSMAVMVIALGCLVFIAEKQLAYAFSLLSVVSMMVSGVFAYCRNMIAVGKDITRQPASKTKKTSV